MVVEITERALAADLAGVLAGAERLRAAGCAIALDDVGAQPESLAFIPVLRPEVVKLDLRLLRTVKDPATVAVAAAVRVSPRPLTPWSDASPCTESPPMST